MLRLAYLIQIFVSTSSFALTLEDAVKSTWDSSPQIQGQITQAELSSGDRYRRFLINSPQFTLTNSDDSTAHSFGLTLGIPFPGKTLAYTRLDSAKERSQNAELLAKKYDLAKLVVQAYLDCSSARELLKIQKETVQDFETLAHSLNALYEKGNTTQSERIGADLQLRQSKADYVALEDKEKSNCEKLEKILGTESLTFLEFPDDLSINIVNEIGSKTADEARSESLVDVASTNSSLSWWSQLPDLSLGATRNHYIRLSGSPANKEWTTTLSVGITVPIFFPFRETVEAKRARSQGEIDQNTAALQLISAKNDRQDAIREYSRSKNRLKEIRQKDLALAEAWVDSTYSAYRTGKLGFAELMSSRKTLADLKAQDVQLRLSIIGAHLRCLQSCNEAKEK